ncbi:MAG: hypothetical protein ACYDC6_05520 [Acidobacteriaceae bacterium]
MFLLRQGKSVPGGGEAALMKLAKAAEIVEKGHAEGNANKRSLINMD